jgi:hypothetical protein
MASGFQGEKVKEQICYIPLRLRASLQTAKSMFSTHQISVFAALLSSGELLSLCCKTLLLMLAAAGV